jgi:hypothetical protein
MFNLNVYSEYSCLLISVGRKCTPCVHHKRGIVNAVYWLYAAVSSSEIPTAHASRTNKHNIMQVEQLLNCSNSEGVVFYAFNENS